MFSDQLIRECLGLPVEQISLEVLLKPYCLKPRNGPWLELMMAIIWKEVTKQDPKRYRDLADLEMRWLCWALKFFNQWDYKCFWLFEMQECLVLVFHNCSLRKLLESYVNIREIKKLHQVIWLILLERRSSQISNEPKRVYCGTQHKYSRLDLDQKNDTLLPMANWELSVWILVVQSFLNLFVLFHCL